jgi:hypothetical protein
MTYEEAMALTPDDKLVITKIDFPANYYAEHNGYHPHTSVGQLARILGDTPDVFGASYSPEKWDGCRHRMGILTISPINGEEHYLNWPISCLRKLGDDKRSSLNPLKRDW